MNWPALATQVATSLVEAALVSADRKAQATAVILAQLKASPPDVTASYHAARKELLDDADELPKGGR